MSIPSDKDIGTKDTSGSMLSADGGPSGEMDDLGYNTISYKRQA